MGHLLTQLVRHLASLQQMGCDQRCTRAYPRGRDGRNNSLRLTCRDQNWFFATTIGQSSRAPYMRRGRGAAAISSAASNRLTMSRYRLVKVAAEILRCLATIAHAPRSERPLLRR